MTIVTTSPVVSVVIPCYGRGEMLHECLQSVVAQELEEWEAIVVDDGTLANDVQEVVEKLHDDRIRYLRHPRNLGPGAARNTGFRAAHADLVLPVRLRRRFGPFLPAGHRGGIAGRPYRRLSRSPISRSSAIRSASGTSALEHSRELLIADWIPGAGTLQRKHVWERTGGYCELPNMTFEDWDFWIGACERGLVAIHIPVPLYRYRQHDEAKTARTWLSDFDARELIYARHRQTFDGHGLGSAFRAAGYFQSSVGYLRAGRRTRSLSLALHAVRLEPRNDRLWRQLAVTLLPASLVAKRRERRLREASRCDCNSGRPADPASEPGGTV